MSRPHFFGLNSPSVHVKRHESKVNVLNQYQSLTDYCCKAQRNAIKSYVESDLGNRAKSTLSSNRKVQLENTNYKKIIQKSFCPFLLHNYEDQKKYYLLDHILGRFKFVQINFHIYIVRIRLIVFDFGVKIFRGNVAALELANKWQVIKV